MNALQPQVQVTFSIKTCKSTLFNLTDFGKQNKKPIDADKYNFLFNFTFNIEDTTKIATFIIKSTLSGNSEIKDDLVNLDSLNEFIIVNYSEIIVTGPNGKPTLPSQILIPMISICISNLRGMYAVKLEDTLYSNATLPLIDAANFVPKNISFVG